MRALVDVARRARLRALISRQLSNGAEGWDAHRAGQTLPPLRFRNGLVLLHNEGDAPLFLLFEVFANACYRRNYAPVDPVGTIVDIGANIGAFTLDCAARFPTARIQAYEPNPRAFRMLEANITANDLTSRVCVYQEAVGRSVGVLRLWGCANSVTATAYPHATDTRDAFAECPMVDLGPSLPVRAVRLVSSSWTRRGQRPTSSKVDRKSFVRSRNASANTTKTGLPTWWGGAGLRSSVQASPSRTRAAADADRCSAPEGSIEAFADDRALVCGCAESAPCPCHGGRRRRDVGGHGCSAPAAPGRFARD